MLKTSISLFGGGTKDYTQKDISLNNILKEFAFKYLSLTQSNLSSTRKCVPKKVFSC